MSDAKERHESAERLSTYLDGLLEAAERISLEEHLAWCERCRRELAELRATVAALGRVAPVRAPRSFALPQVAPAWQRWLLPLRVATAAAALLMVAAFGADLLRPESGLLPEMGTPGVRLMQQAAPTPVPAPMAAAPAPTAAPAPPSSAEKGAAAIEAQGQAARAPEVTATPAVAPPGAEVEGEGSALLAATEAGLAALFVLLLGLSLAVRFRSRREP